MNKKTKIICTLGPSVDSEEKIRELIEAGMDIARFNFSHGTHKAQAKRVRMIQKVREEMGVPIGMMLDTKGPEIRTGRLVDHQPIPLKEGDTIILTNEEVPGTAERIFQDCHMLPRYVQPGTIILVDDGLIELEVISADDNDIKCRILNSETLGERKSVNIPGVAVPLPAVTDADRADLLFGIEHGFDFIAASFMRDQFGVRTIREFCQEHGAEDITIIAKIENPDAVENIDDIIEEADGIMVARGDLGVEVAEYRVPHIQKQIIHKCNKAHKPVITATQMLDSMMRNPRATRAEVGDVANAIYDGTDCVMLSGETAVGKYPIEAVEMMASIAKSTEKHLFDDGAYVNRKQEEDENLISLAVGTAAMNTAEAVGARCIVCPTMTGKTARLIASFRTPIPIYAVTPNEDVVRSMQIYWGVTPIQGNVQGDMGHVIANARDAVLNKGLVDIGDIAVFTSGDRWTSPIIRDENGQTGRYAPTNVMYVVQIREEVIDGDALMTPAFFR